VSSPNHGGGFVTRGILTRPSGAAPLTTRGRLRSTRSAYTGTTDPVPVLSTASLDTLGTARLVHDEVLDTQFVEVDRMRFSHPDRTYTGFAADGFWYANGVVDPAHSPPRATWALEAQGTNRGELDTFPTRLFVVTTREEVVLIDADTLDVWFRVLRGVSNELLGNSRMPRAASFVEGFLVIATDNAPLILDFGLDQSVILGTGSSVAVTAVGLSARNATTYTDTTVTLPGGDRLVASVDCLSVGVGLVASPTLESEDYTVLAAVGHPTGLSAIRLRSPGDATYPVVHPHEFKLTQGAWLTVDDGDGDATTPYFTAASTNWSGLGVEEGDTLDIMGMEIVITEVLGDRLSVTPEIPLAASGASYNIFRPVNALLIKDTTLYFASGQRRIRAVRDDTWFDLVTALYGADFIVATDEGRLSPSAGDINDIALRGTDVYAATGNGVHILTDDNLEDNAVGLYAYSTLAVVDQVAAYRILQGTGINCTALAIDPETGNLTVAASTPSASVISEVDIDNQQAFRFFDEVGRVNSLLAFRNTNGPPDVEVS